MRQSRTRPIRKRQKTRFKMPCYYPAYTETHTSQKKNGVSGRILFNFDTFATNFRDVDYFTKMSVGFFLQGYHRPFGGGICWIIYALSNRPRKANKMLSGQSRWVLEKEGLVALGSLRGDFGCGFHRLPYAGATGSGHWGEA